MRFGIPALLWGGLLAIAWSRQRRQELPREKLLVWGFGMGFAREVFMFFHVTMRILDPTSHNAISFLSEPLEHGLAMGAVIVVAGSFLRYILDDPRLARNYLRLGLAATGVAFLATSFWWSKLSQADPSVSFQQTWASWIFHITVSVFVIAAIYHLSKRRGWLRNVVSTALSFFLMDELAKMFNFFTHKSYADILCPLGNSFHIWAVPLLGYVYLREQSIEKQRAEAQLDAYRNHLEELVEARTTEIAHRNAELAAQNTIAATISKSLELDTILNDALDMVLDVTNVEAGAIFLLEPDGETLVLKTYRGEAPPEVCTASVEGRNLCADISAQAVARNEPAILNVADRPAKLCTPFVLEEGIETLTSIPLVSRGKALGALTLGARRQDAIPPQDVPLLTAIGQQIGVAIENAHLYHETERWAEELTLLHQVSVFLSSTFDPQTICDQMVEQAAKLLDCQAAYVFRWDGAPHQALRVSRYGSNEADPGEDRIDLEGDALLPSLITQRRAIPIEDIRSDPRVSRWCMALTASALVCLPVWGKMDPLGFLVLIDRRGPRRWRPDELTLIESFVNRAAIALENAYLHQQVERAAALEERQRIAAEMHDGLAQTMSYLGFKTDEVIELAGQGASAQVADACQQMRDIIDRAAREVRLSISSLQESPRPRQSLQAELAALVAEVAAQNEPAPSLVTALQTPLFLSPNDVEQVLRVVQEALLNACRHAQAQRIVVRLEQQEREATVVVEDDGRGFDLYASAVDKVEHFGLRIMRARAARIGGHVRIDSAPGNGTQVSLSWPLNGDQSPIS
ncbi:MAG: GAF domain-containing sensor histidine kinase [Anaerolineae bacterium]|nr:GAF domain-containing sensor histidine kinase [Anaerolineae bacterium]